MFSQELKNRVLERFVTSADDSIYAVKNNVPPEMFGAIGSYFSRNPKDFREHLWDAITGQIEEEKAIVDERDLEWLIDDNLKEPYHAIKKGIAKSQDFFKKWYGKYSHKSIANTVWMPMVATNVSQLFAKEMAYDQLAFFIEQSTRFVRFDAKNVYNDLDVMGSRHKQTYQNALELMANNYHEFTEECITYYKQQIPFDDWQKLQNEQTLNKDRQSIEAKYNREIRAKALDIARFLLPQATKTNLAWILDARSTEFDIAAWKGHPLREIRDAALLIEKHAGQIAPSLLKYTEKSDYYARKLNDYGSMLRADKPTQFNKGAVMIGHDNSALDKTVAYLLFKHNIGGTFSQRYLESSLLNFEDKIKVLDEVTAGRGKHDEWVEMDEDFDMVKVAFEIRTDIGAVRDWRRHQKWDRSEPRYTLDNGYHKPYMVRDMGNKANEIFDRSINAAHNAEILVRDEFPHQAQYLLPMATNHTIAMSGGLDQLQYLVWTRSTVEGNFSYRQDAFNIAEAVAKVHPWLLGYREYPKEKSFLDIYKEAPLKNLLRLDTRETGLHQ